jgi:tetratricopeptide (TPR) repeat protein
MAKKKREPGDGSRKRRHRANPTADGAPDLPDPRAMEGEVQRLWHSLRGNIDQDTPQGQAQALMLRAFGEADDDRRRQLAQEALALWPDCADAYLLLGQQAPGLKESLDLYQKAVAAGERALGPEFVQRHAGSFWTSVETRSYLLARQELALALWAAGRRDEAVQHLQDMLRLNPNDNQGVRYTLAGFLLFLDRDEDLARLLQQYADEDSATWAYTKALLSFRQHGDMLESRKLLKTAKKANKHVPEYLLGRRQPPGREAGHYSPGDNNEALNYLGSFLPAWKSTAGAIAWLRANDEKSRKSKNSLPAAKGPFGVIKKWLKSHLPQANDEWQAGCRPMPTWTEIGGENVRLWVILAISQSSDLVLGHLLTPQEPTTALVWDVLVQAMQHPLAGEAHRPAKVHVQPGELWESLRPHLEAIDVKLEVSESLAEFDHLFNEMVEHVCGKREPGLLDMPGITSAQVAGFYEAAATFFQQAPWKKVGYESAIQIACDKYHSGPWYGVLMGQSGLLMGLALYENMDMLRQMWSRELDEEDNARQSVATVASFGEEWDIPVADLDAARHHGWKVARADAWPSIYHKERGLSARPPLTWELELMEGCLRAVPEFVKRRGQEDSAREEFTVPVASGELRLTLSWVQE